MLKGYFGTAQKIDRDISLREAFHLELFSGCMSGVEPGEFKAVV